MNVALSEIDLPVRLRFQQAMTDEQLEQFCATNDSLRVEREPNGEILVMTPAGSNTGKINLRIGRFLDEWAEGDGTGVAFDSSAGFTLPDGSMRSPDGAWIRNDRWRALSEKTRAGSHPSAQTSSSNSARPAISCPISKPKCSSGSPTAPMWPG